MSYGEDLACMYRRAACFLDRIIKTPKANPVPNPDSILALADRVIEWRCPLFAMQRCVDKLTFVGTAWSASTAEPLTSASFGAPHLCPTQVGAGGLSAGEQGRVRLRRASETTLCEDWRKD